MKVWVKISEKSSVQGYLGASWRAFEARLESQVGVCQPRKVMKGSVASWRHRGAVGNSRQPGKERGRGSCRDEVKELDRSRIMKGHVCPAKDFSFILLTKTWSMS